MQTLHELPNDIAALKQLVLTQQAQLQSREWEIERLKLQLARLRRMQFGRSSEQLSAEIAQLELQLGALEVNQGERIPATLTASLDKSTERRQPKRRPLPPHLPREIITHTPACLCPECGGELRHIGEDVAEIIERVPEHFKVIRHVRPKFSCAHCQSLVQCAAPSRPIARGMAGPGFIAHVLVSKYGDHLPLYRQSQILERQQIDIDRSTLSGWVSSSTTAFIPLGHVLMGYVLSAGKLHADDTPLPVLEPGLGKTKTGRLWTYVRDDRPAGSTDPSAVWFAYSPDRKGMHPNTHLAHYSGVLQADGYAGFNGLYDRTKSPLMEAACWAHVRRKLFDYYETTESPIALEGLHRIGALSAIEEDINGQLPDIRRSVRQARAVPLLKDLHAWFSSTIQQLNNTTRKSELAIAINYTLTRWEALTCYCNDGRIDMTNNTAERSLRAVALGRKNYLFAGSDKGGERAAMMYSLIGTCKLNAIDPEAYLRYVLTHIADHPVHLIEELLPWNVAPVLKA